MRTGERTIFDDRHAAGVAERELGKRAGLQHLRHVDGSLGRGSGGGRGEAQGEEAEQKQNVAGKDKRSHDHVLRRAMRNRAGHWTFSPRSARAGRRDECPFGGRGRIVGRLLGALVIASFANGLDLLGQSADESAVWAGAVN